MQDIDIRNKCTVNSNYEMDTFVGLKCDGGDIGIHFPLGYHISEDNKGLRRDILLLFAALAANTGRKDSELSEQGMKTDEVELPLQSYMYIAMDYLVRGYYREQEIIYNPSKRGRINWNRTIKTQKPYVQDNEVFYLDFITKKNAIKENEMITLIHKYCVYESFDKIGWLYTKTMPQKPWIKRNDKVFKTIIKTRLSLTFNDKNRQLFRHMLSIIDYKGDKDANKIYKYGTYRFEYVWEQMIDKVFGIENKADYFPKTTWRIDGENYNNPSLEPDTIMIYRNNVYILDAKYYKYGVTGRQGDLPGSASISKQITYGEYVNSQNCFKQIHGEGMKVYNAFLMPFDSRIQKSPGNSTLFRVGVAVSNWKDNSEDYHKIQGILIDIKELMSINIRQEESEIIKLAAAIEQA